MSDEEVEVNSTVVRSGVRFLRELGRAYGNERAVAMWDSMRVAMGEQVCGAIFTGMMDRPSGYSDECDIEVKGTPQSKIEAIKGVRIGSNMGLKEAKDFVEAMTPYEAKSFTCSKTASESIADFDKRIDTCIDQLRRCGYQVKIT
jgi:ribosomal protein L7/L12